jgi:hypothetical protein
MNIIMRNAKAWKNIWHFYPEFFVVAWLTALLFGLTLANLVKELQ